MRLPDGAACAVHPPWNALGEDPADAVEPHGSIHDAEGGRPRPGRTRTTPKRRRESVSARSPRERAPRACRSGIARGRKRCGKSISEGCVCRLGRTEGPTGCRYEGADSIAEGARARGGLVEGAAGSRALAGPEPSGTEPGGAKRKSALGSAVHHFGCAEVIPCPSRRRRDASDHPLSE